MSQTAKLFSIEYHTDDETGMYKIGEIDHAISHELKEYLGHFGIVGKDELIKHMSFMIYYIENLYRELNPSESAQC